MADLNGAYQRPYNWTNDALQGIPIDQGRMDDDGKQVAAALNNRVFADGSASNVTADIPMGNHSFTGLRPGAAKGEPATFEQISFGAFTFCAGIVF